MKAHTHKWEQCKYFECAIQCVECKEIVGDNHVVNLVNVLTTEQERYRHDLARAIALIDEQISFSEADKFAGTTLFETWQEVQAALKQSS